LHRTRDRAASRLDLTRGDTLGLERLQAVGAEGQAEPTLRQALDPTLVRLPELRPLRTQHGANPLALRRLLGGALVLRHRVMAQNLALEDPHLDTAGAVGGL